MGITEDDPTAIVNLVSKLIYFSAVFENLERITISYFLSLQVERNPEPDGYALVDPNKSGKKSQFDLVELASQIQTADQVLPLSF